MESLLYPCASIKQVLQSLDLSRSERSVQSLFAPSRTQSKTFGAHLNLKTRLNCFSAVFAYRIVLICRATPASHAPRLALTRELQMWRACSTPAPASNKFCIFTKVLHLSEVHRRSELSHLSEVHRRSELSVFWPRDAASELFGTSATISPLPHPRSYRVLSTQQAVNYIA